MRLSKDIGSVVEQIGILVLFGLYWASIYCALFRARVIFIHFLKTHE
jgi:hypothetical protein